MILFETERLIVRKFVPDDWQDLYEYFSDAEILKFEPYEPLNEEQCREAAIYRSQSSNFFAVCLKDNKKLIGNLYVQKTDETFNTWEIGYVFNRAFHGNGYASESVNAMMNYLFNQKEARRIIAMCDPLNGPSWKLLERVGMRREAHHKKEIYFKCDTDGNPIWKDTFVYALLKEEV